MPPLLEIEKVTRHFGGLAALQDVDLVVRQGEMVGVIGPNGAGKTTLFNLITGFLRPSAGQIHFKQSRISGRRPDVIARRGISRTFQLTRLFDDLTVLQNVVVGGHLHSHTGIASFFVSGNPIPRNETECAMSLLEFVGIAHLSSEFPKNLPHGHQRALDVAIAMASGAELLLLDEPLSGMNLDEMRKMLSIMSSLRTRGTTILLVEHNMKAVMDTCDRIAVLNFGRKIAEGMPNEIAHNRDVIEAYLGLEEDDVAYHQ